MMRITERGIVCQSIADSDRQSLAFPGICITSGGQWLCTFRAGPTKEGSIEQTLLTASTDEGRSWGEPNPRYQYKIAVFL